MLVKVIALAMVLGSLVGGRPAPGALYVPSIYGASMVLQHGAPVHFWGTAERGSQLTINYFDKEYKTTASKDGVWNVTFPPRPPSLTPTDIVIEAVRPAAAAAAAAAAAGLNTNKAWGEKVVSDKLTLSDVVVGKVFLCSGQSNMGLGVDGTFDAPAVLAAAGSHGSG